MTASTQTKKLMGKFEELEKHRFAHRGYHDKPVIAENSMTAFRRAKDRNFGAELDIHLMADGNLAVIHDSSLKRTAGADIKIEDLRIEDLSKYTLEESGEHIPLFEEVLELKLPLIVELKTEGGNYNALAAAAWERLKNYDAPFCVESFDPRALLWFKKNQPQVCRGQLSRNFFINPEVGMPEWQKTALSRMWLNFLTKPDFIAYKHEDRDNKYLEKCRKRGIREVSWTIHSKEDLNRLEALGNIPIFEKFDPEEK